MSHLVVIKFRNGTVSTVRFRSPANAMEAIKSLMDHAGRQKEGLFTFSERDSGSVAIWVVRVEQIDFVSYETGPETALEVE